MNSTALVMLLWLVVGVLFIAAENAVLLLLWFLIGIAAVHVALERDDE
jgi:hypothetical protein